jgi:hypothetical protein
MNRETKLVASKLSMGKPCWFYPDMGAGEQYAGQRVKAKVVGVTYTDYGKVLYDLALACPDQETGYYEVLPIRGVDSFMCGPWSAAKPTLVASP